MHYTKTALLMILTVNILASAGLSSSINIEDFEKTFPQEHWETLGLHRLTDEEKMSLLKHVDTIYPDENFNRNHLLDFGLCFPARIQIQAGLHKLSEQEQYLLRMYVVDTYNYLHPPLRTSPSSKTVAKDPPPPIRDYSPEHVLSQIPPEVLAEVRSRPSYQSRLAAALREDREDQWRKEDIKAEVEEFVLAAQKKEIKRKRIWGGIGIIFVLFLTPSIFKKARAADSWSKKTESAGEFDNYKPWVKRISIATLVVVIMYNFTK